MLKAKPALPKVLATSATLILATFIRSRPRDDFSALPSTRYASCRCIGDKPTRIGNYEVIDEIGRGGTGVVYRARDLRLGREVAIKVLMPQAITTQMRARFVRESRVMAGMEDRGILPIFEVIDDAHRPSIVMPIMEGGSLSGKIADNRFGCGSSP